MPDMVSPPSRVGFVDAAKGISIFLVVYWHAVDDRLLLNEALWMLRMPLFFFASGLFASKVLELDWKPFLVKKVGNIFYLYILWTFLVFASTVFVAQLVGPDPIEWIRPFLLFVEPPATLWFMYALGVSFILAKLLSRLPWIPVFFVLLLFYLWSISHGDWRTPPFYEKVMRLFPFFYLALNIRNRFLTIVEANYRFGWLALPIFIASAFVIFQSSLSSQGLVTFPLSLLGVTGVAIIARALNDSALVQMISAIGKRSLFIYVMHRIPLFYIEHLMELLGVEKTALSMSVVAFIATGMCLFVGEKILMPLLNWTFDAPWLSERERLQTRLTRAT